MTTTRLRIYNGALLLLGELGLDLTTGLDEDREARRLLDSVWNDDGVNYCLEQAQWYFAMRSTRLDFNPAVEPAWGYKRAFDKPSDWVLTSGVFENEYLTSPLIQYADEASFWYTDREEIFVKYVSDHADFGNDLARWPATFTDYVKAYFASRIVHKIPNAVSKVEFLLGPTGREDKGHLNYLLLKARNKAAMVEPATFPFRGFWSRARHAGSRRGFGQDGGNTGRLIG
jgi:hypothetical protein